MNLNEVRKENIESTTPPIKNIPIYNNNLYHIPKQPPEWIGRKKGREKPTINCSIKNTTQQQMIDKRNALKNAKKNKINNEQSNNNSTTITSNNTNSNDIYNNKIKNNTLGNSKYEFLKNTNFNLKEKNENKNDNNKKVEYDYNYYLFKSKRGNFENNKHSEIKQETNKNENKDNSTHKEKEISKPHYSSYASYKIPKYLGDYSYYERHLIGNGSFGKVFCGIHRYRKFRVAIKLPTEKSNSDMIDKEVQFTRKMANEPGFPILFFSSVINDKYVMIESLLGPSLDKLFNYCDKSFPMKTICLIGMDIVKRLRSMHKAGLLHRDLKPNNFAWGNYSKNYYGAQHTYSTDYEINQIYLIDFGLSETYIDPATGLHYKSEKGEKFIGTLRYSSVNSHKGIRQCRKDDLESLMYILVYFYKGKLPWQDVKAKQKDEKHQKIKEEKMRYTAEMLCKDMPQEIEKMLCYVKNILYSEEPNYERLLSGFQKIINSLTEWETLENDYNYIWEKKLHDDYKKKMFSIDEAANKKICENIGTLFKGYPSEIRNFIEKISINGSNKIKKIDNKNINEKKV